MKITNEEIIIIPDDHDQAASVFYEGHLNSFEDVAVNRLRLIQGSGRPPINLYFRTAKQIQRVLKRVRMTKVSESTPESTATPTPEPTNEASGHSPSDNLIAIFFDKNGTPNLFIISITLYLSELTYVYLLKC